jgi:hypothetical protein
MFAAEHHDWDSHSSAIGAGAQTPPEAQRIDDRDAGAALQQQPLVKTLYRVRLARTSGADDRNPVIERFVGCPTPETKKRLLRGPMRLREMIDLGYVLRRMHEPERNALAMPASREAPALDHSNFVRHVGSGGSCLMI